MNKKEIDQIEVVVMAYAELKTEEARKHAVTFLAHNLMAQTGALYLESTIEDFKVGIVAEDALVKVRELINDEFADSTTCNFEEEARKSWEDHIKVYKEDGKWHATDDATGASGSTPCEAIDNFWQEVKAEEVKEFIRSEMIDRAIKEKNER